MEYFLVVKGRYLEAAPDLTWKTRALSWVWYQENPSGQMWGSRGHGLMQRETGEGALTQPVETGRCAQVLCYRLKQGAMNPCRIGVRHLYKQYKYYSICAINIIYIYNPFTACIWEVKHWFSKFKVSLWAGNYWCQHLSSVDSTPKNVKFHGVFGGCFVGFFFRAS